MRFDEKYTVDITKEPNKVLLKSGEFAIGEMLQKLIDNMGASRTHG